MNSIAASASPKPDVAKRVVANVLLAMLCITAAMDGENSFLNASDLLLLVWPMSMIFLACYWLRVFLSERISLEDAVDINLRPNPVGSGFHLPPVFLIRT